MQGCATCASNYTKPLTARPSPLAAINAKVRRYPERDDDTARVDIARATPPCPQDKVTARYDAEIAQLAAAGKHSCPVAETA